MREGGIVRVIVTGAGGFIGRHLLRYLEGSSFDIHEVSRSRGYDLSVPGWTQALPSDVDVVIHLAQSKRYRDFPEQSADIYDVNVSAMMELLEWSRRSQVKKFIYTSSGSVYSSNTRDPLSERAPLAPSHFYGATKAAAELLLSAYQPFFKTQILRLFTVYGPGQRAMLISNMIDRVRSQEPIYLARDGGFVFSAIYVLDCVRLLTRFIEEDSPFPVLNIASDERYTLEEVVDFIAHRLSVTPNLERVERDPGYSLADISQLSSLNYIDRFVSREEGLAACLSGDLRSL